MRYSDKLRDQAERCLQLAGEIDSPAIARTLRGLADDFLARADRIEETDGDQRC